MKIVKDLITIAELKEMAPKMFGNLVKAVVDVEKNIMAVDGELHSDLMELMIEHEHSEPKNIWGINFYPELAADAFIEFDSMINLKPGLGNRTRGVESKEVQEKIRAIVAQLVK